MGNGSTSAALVAIAALAITAGRSEALPESPGYQAAAPRSYTVDPNPRPDGKQKVTFADGTFAYMTVTADGVISREEYEESEIVLPSGLGIVRGEIAGAATGGVAVTVGDDLRLELFRNGSRLLRGHYSTIVEGEGQFVLLSSLFSANSETTWIANISEHPEMLRQTMIKPPECADPELVPSGWIIWWVGCSATIPPAVYSPDGQRRIIKQPGGIYNISSGDDWIMAGSLTHDGQRFTIGDVRRNQIAIEATESGMTGASVSFTGAWLDLRPDGVGTCLQSVGRVQERSEPCAFRNGIRVDLAHFARVDAVEQERAALEAEREAREAYFRLAAAEVRQIAEARQREHDQIVAAQSREQRRLEQERDEERAAVFGGLVNDLGDMVDRAAADMDANNRAFAEAQENIRRAAESDRQYRAEQEARQREEQGRVSQSSGQTDSAEAARRATQARQNADEARRRVAQINASAGQDSLRIRQAEERRIADEQRAAEAQSRAGWRSGAPPTSTAQRPRVTEAEARALLDQGVFTNEENGLVFTVTYPSAFIITAPTSGYVMFDGSILPLSITEFTGFQNDDLGGFSLRGAGVCRTYQGVAGSAAFPDGPIVFESPCGWAFNYEVSQNRYQFGAGQLTGYRNRD